MENTFFTREQNTEVICRFLKNLWNESLKGQFNAVFFNSPDGRAFSAFLNSNVNDIVQGARIFRCKMKEGCFREAYQPFLGFIQESCARKKPSAIKTLLRQAELYPLHRPVFQSFLISGEATRKEEIIYEELGFEKKLMLESIAKIIFRLSEEEKLVLILEDLHLAGESTLQFLHYLMDEHVRKPILLMGVCSKEYPRQSEEEAATWEDFIDSLENRNILLDFALDNPVIVQTSTEQQPLLSTCIGKALQHCYNSFQFLALEECQNDINLIFHCKIEQDIKMSEHDLFRLYNLLGDVSRLTGEDDSALIHYSAMLNLATMSRAEPQMANAYWKMSLVHCKTGRYETALEFALRSLELAEQIRDQLLILSALTVLVRIGDKARNLLRADWTGFTKKAIELARKLHMVNTFTYICSNIHFLYDMLEQEADGIWDEGIRTARRLGNLHRLVVAYQEMGCAIANLKGDYQAVLPCYKKSLLLTLQMGNKLEITYGYNAMGYYYFLVGRYDKAHFYYSEALNCLKSVRAYSELGVTLFNIALNYFLAFKHDLAAYLLEKILQIMSILKINSLKYQSLFGIYSLLSLSYCSAGNFPKAYEYMAMVKMKGLSEQSNEQTLFYHLANAALFQAEAAYSEAERCYREARACFGPEETVIKYFLPRFYYEHARLREANQDLVGAAQDWRKGLAVSLDSGIKFYQELFNDMLAGRSGNPARLRLPSTNVLWAIESVKQEVNLVRLRKKVNEINFLNVVQNLLTMGSEKEPIVQGIMELVQGTFLLDVGIALLKEEDWSCIYSYGVPDSFQFELIRLLPRIFKEKQGKPVAADNYPLCVAIGINRFLNFRISNKGQDVVDLFFGLVGRTIDLTTEELQVLNIAFNQLSEALERVEREEELIEKNRELSNTNQQLAKVAVTDALTGLANRFALMKWFVEGKRRYHYLPTSTLLFLDLDHFKYYNDTFGHQVGDLVLCRFADILRSVVRGEDFAARYGGDEFIILLPGAGVQEAVKVAQRINKKLTNQKRFDDEIARMLGRAVHVPEEYWLSCSVGISELPGKWEDMNLETFLDQADKALYLAKQSGKKQHKTWFDVVSSTEQT